MEVTYGGRGARVISPAQLSTEPFISYCTFAIKFLEGGRCDSLFIVNAILLFLQCERLTSVKTCSSIFLLTSNHYTYTICSTLHCITIP
jgi:hypothetical protein